MNTTLNLLALAALSTAPEVIAQDHGDPYRPVGTLNVGQNLVRTGVRSSLAWDITYPKTIADVLTPGPTGTITTKEELRLQVRVAGVALQSGSTPLPVGFWTKIGGGSWQQNFYGTETAVHPNEYVIDQVVPANTTIDFAGRGRSSDGSWYDIRWTATQDPAVIGLVNGDYPPAYAPAYAQGGIESFLTGLIGKSNNGHGNNADGVDVSNPGQGGGGPNGAPDTDYNGDGVIDALDDDENRNRATIGPLDMIYLFELASGDPGDWNFDMQELVIVATFTPTGN